MPPILEARNLVKKFGKLTAVNKVSFQIEMGEIFSLLGPNGAGKTTTIAMLSTLIAPDAGDAWIHGKSITREQMHVRRLIGVVPQEIALYETLSARENLIFWGHMQGLSGTELGSRVEKILEQIGLAERARQRVETFSGGMKRRLNIGVGLLHEPEIIFMDEPTVGIDPQSRRNILDAVKDLNRQGMSVLYTTHYMEEAQELSNRIGIIDHGEMIACGTHKELTQMVGENETLRLHVAENTDLDPLADGIRKMPAVIKVSISANCIDLIVPEAEEALPAVIAHSNDLGIKIRSIDIQEPDLETVFLHLTGRALRD